MSKLQERQNFLSRAREQVQHRDRLLARIASQGQNLQESLSDERLLKHIDKSLAKYLAEARKVDDSLPSIYVKFGEEIKEENLGTLSRLEAPEGQELYRSLLAGVEKSLEGFSRDDSNWNPSTVFEYCMTRLKKAYIQLKVEKTSTSLTDNGQ